MLVSLRGGHPHPTPHTLQAATAAGRGLDEEGAGRAWGLLAHAPYLVPFRERAKLFQAVVAQVGGLGWAAAAWRSMPG